MSDLTDPMVRAITALPPRSFHVGDPDPTPDHLPYKESCYAAHRGYLCTWPKGHADSLPHVAGTGERIVAVWGGAPLDAVTVTLTRAQADAVISMVEYGTDETLDELADHPYTEQEESEALAECITAETAVAIIAAALAEQENRA